MFPLKWHRGYFISILLGMAMCALGTAMADAVAHTDDPLPITIVAQDGFNLAVVDQPDENHVVVNLTTPAHNFFAGTLTHLPTDTETTIGLSMTGNDTDGNPADVGKWAGLVPVMTYADPTRYASYECFVKDKRGHWMSTDPLKPVNARDAGTGKVPRQQVIPPDLAAQFLAPDGKSWSPWRDVERTECLTAVNIFRMKHRFARSTATIAMRVPYTYTYLQAFLERLRAAQLPGVYLDEIGTTPAGRKLQILRLEDPTGLSNEAEHQTIFVIAREHATEPASSWVLHGLLKTVLTATNPTSKLRTGRTWLILPIQDPDGSADAVFDRMTDHFLSPDAPTTPPEVYTYARYVADYVYSGHTIDCTLVLHNVEANETPNLFCPFIDARFAADVVAFNRRFFSAASAQGYVTADPASSWGNGLMTNRLYGWTAKHFGSFDLCYEVNDRFPNHRLSLPQLTGIGKILATSLSQWTAESTGRRWHDDVRHVLATKETARSTYYRMKNRGPADRNRYDLLCQGY